MMAVNFRFPLLRVFTDCVLVCCASRYCAARCAAGRPRTNHPLFCSLRVILFCLMVACSWWHGVPVIWWELIRSLDDSYQTFITCERELGEHFLFTARTTPIRAVSPRSFPDHRAARQAPPAQQKPQPKPAKRLTRTGTTWAQPPSPTTRRETRPECWRGDHQ